MTPITVKLKSREDDRLKAGHPWIFSNEVAEASAPAEPGDLAFLYGAGGESLGCGLYNPRSLIAYRSLSRERVPEEGLAGLFRSRLGAALALRERLYPGETAGRLCFSESDGMPGLVIDRYGDFLALQVLSAGMERRLDSVVEALKDLLNPTGICAKNDHRMRALEGLEPGDRILWGNVPEEVRITQDGVEFAASITGGQKTGFYFDQRENRAFLRPYAKGRRVLDLYCYSGGFALNAAKGGAESVLGIDSSAEAVAAARGNAQANGLEKTVHFEEADAAQVLQDLSSGAWKEVAPKPDLIVLDPPNLCPSKKDLPRALRAYAKLNALALGALPPGGLLATASCSHHVTRELFVAMLRGAQAKAQRPARLAALRSQAQDHPVLLAMPESEYLHFALLEII